MYNLTENQKNVLRWIVQEVRNGALDEEFSLIWLTDNVSISDYKGSNIEEAPDITKGALDALVANDLLYADIRSKTSVSKSGKISHSETSRRCTLTGKAYEAVDSNFNAPDTSFVRQLTPLADITNLDDELKSRCLPILGAGSADPKLWDSAVRTAGVILEERLRDIGGITNPSRVGRDLVNDVFGQTGSLASKFTLDAERVGYRDTFAGIVGAFRNPYAHRLIDPKPEDGGAFIVFINLLLKLLEDLR